MATNLPSSSGRSVGRTWRSKASGLARGVLEELLRKLCGKHALTGTLPPRATIDPMNNALKKANVYGKIEGHQITAWAAIRNAAAHANHGAYTAEQVKLMIQGLRS